MVHLTTALDAASGVPLYEQLYRSLAAEMRTGAISAGTRMPGKRRLAAELSVSVNTVDAAYQMLAAEGYLEARERSGFYVQEYLALPERTESAAPPQPEAAPAPEQPVRYDLSTRGVDPELFPFRTWARLQKELLYSSPELLTHGDAQGDLSLRQALAEYLEEYRGVRCGPHQIVVGAGLEYLLGLLAPLLPGPAAVENPGYPRARQVLENNGISCCCLPVDEDGLSIRALSESGAAVCYVTPSHQFPTGVTMPAGRRAELLHWAARRPGQRYIIEDDYDSEFRFTGRPIPTLQSIDRSGRVIYMNTFSRTLAPSLRISYMVLPPALLEDYHRRLGFYSCTVPAMEQYTLARFLSGGGFETHVNRMRVFYRGRRDQVLSALEESPLKGRYTVRGEDAGLHFLVGLDTLRSDREMARLAQEAGIRLSFLTDYGGGEEHWLVVNYPGADLERLPQALERLAVLL